MTALTDFLLARIAEDEATAHAAIYADRAGRWRVSTDSQDERVLVLESSGFQMLRAVQEPATADHAARHDPARVLAEVDAKRRIVEARAALGPIDDVMDRDTAFFAQGLDECIAHLAAVYADHPDFDPAWRL